MKVGCCGWSYFGKKKGFKSVLQSYASVYDCVEINSTFYRIPKTKTAERWRSEVNEVNPSFEFSVKCNKTITHIIKFGKKSVKIFDSMKEICKALNSRILLFQTPASFKPTEGNIKRMKSFFENIDRENLTLVWESRGEWRKSPEKVKEVCKMFDLSDCVDPLRSDPVYFGKKKLLYFRLHGFGFPSMYSYTFNEDELKEVAKRAKKIKVGEKWILFNNSDMYDNAVQFISILKNLG